MPKLYYTPPTQEQFDELKAKAIEIWLTYDNTYGYVDEKVQRIAGIGNIEDNFMYMVAMFDSDNQIKLAGKLSKETKNAVYVRMVDGGQPDLHNYFGEWLGLVTFVII